MKLLRTSVLCTNLRETKITIFDDWLMIKTTHESTDDDIVFISKSI